MNPYEGEQYHTAEVHYFKETIYVVTQESPPVR